MLGRFDCAALCGCIALLYHKNREIHTWWQQIVAAADYQGFW